MRVPINIINIARFSAPYISERYSTEYIRFISNGTHHKALATDAAACIRVEWDDDMGVGDEEYIVSADDLLAVMKIATRKRRDGLGRVKYIKLSKTFDGKNHIAFWLNPEKALLSEIPENKFPDVEHVLDKLLEAPTCATLENEFFNISFLVNAFKSIKKITRGQIDLDLQIVKNIDNSALIMKSIGDVTLEAAILPRAYDNPQTKEGEKENASTEQREV